MVFFITALKVLLCISEHWEEVSMNTVPKASFYLFCTLYNSVAAYYTWYDNLFVMLLLPHLNLSTFVSYTIKQCYCIPTYTAFSWKTSDTPLIPLQQASDIFRCQRKRLTMLIDQTGRGANLLLGTGKTKPHFIHVFI